MSYILLYFLLLSANNTIGIHPCDNKVESLFYVSITYIDMDIDFCYALECGEIDETEDSERVAITNPLTEIKLMMFLHSLKKIKNNKITIDTRRRMDIIFNDNVVLQVCIARFYVQINHTYYLYSGKFKNLVESIIERQNLSPKSRAPSFSI